MASDRVVTHEELNELLARLEVVNVQNAQLADQLRSRQSSDNNQIEIGTNVMVQSAMGLPLVKVQESTPTLQGLDKPTVNKLTFMVVKLKKDLTNFTQWDAQLRNAMDMIGVTKPKLEELMAGTLRPSTNLNRTLKALIIHSIDNDDEVLHNLVNIYITDDDPNYSLNSSLAIYATIKKYYRSQAQKRSVTLLQSLDKMKFTEASLIEYNATYANVFFDLKDMGIVSESLRDIETYVRSLGDHDWVLQLRQVLETIPDSQHKLRLVMELAARQFLMRFPTGRRTNANVFIVQQGQNRTRQQHNRAGARRGQGASGLRNCRNCGRNHAPNKCPAQGTTCSYCGVQNHWKKCCLKLKRDQSNGTRGNENSEASRTEGAALAVGFPSNPVLELEEPTINFWGKMIGIMTAEGHRMLIDSGASITLTGDKTILKNFVETPIRRLDTVGHETIEVVGKGDLTIPLDFGDVTLQCHYSPDTEKKLTLISVVDLQRVGVGIMFEPDGGNSYLLFGEKRHDLERYNNCYIMKVSHPEEPKIDSVTQWQAWHKRLGHISYAKLKDMFGSKVTIAKEAAKCAVCDEANTFVNSFKIKNAVVEEVNLRRFQIQPEYAYMDYKVLNDGYILHIVFNGWLELFHQATKNESEVNIDFFLQGLQVKPKRIVADLDTPFKDLDFKRKMIQKGMPVKLVAPLHHQLNAAEPRIRYSMEKIRALILDLGDIEISDHKTMLTLIVNYVAYLLNRTGKAPTAFEKRFGKAPDLRLLQPFYSDCIVPKLKRPNNLEPKGLKVKFVGYDRESLAPTCLLLNPSTGQLLRRAFIDCSFYPLGFEPRAIDDPVEERPEVLEESDTDSDDESDVTTSPTVAPTPLTPTSIPEHQEPWPETPTSSLDEESRDFADWSHMKGARQEDYGTTLDDGIRRSRRLMISAVLSREDIQYGHELRNASNEIKALFQKPIDEEVENLFRHKVIEPVSEVPPGVKVINSQFVLTVKRDGRAKARWVACGNQQGVLSHWSTYTPTVNRSLVLLMLKYGRSEGLDVNTIDVSSAYLYGRLPKDQQVYIRAPYPLPSQIYKVVGNLYGLKQAGQIWNRVFTEKLRDFGLQQSVVDPCLFVRLLPRPLLLLLHVDDGLIIGSNQDANDLAQHLMRDFKIKLNDGDDFLGVTIEKRVNGDLFVTQKHYIAKLLAKFNFSTSKPTSTPMAYHNSLTAVSPNEVCNDVGLFQSLLGCVSYLRLTRPDIVFALHELATVASAPGDSALTAIKRLCRYLKGTMDYGIVIAAEQNAQWTCYFDASFASSASLKSVGGHCIFFGTTPILSQSYTITHAVDSSGHAEAYALHHAVKEMQFVQNVLTEIKHKFSFAILFTDSKAVYDFTFKSGSGKRSRHWHIVLHYLKHHVGPNKELRLKLTPGTENAADIFTKALGPTLFKKFCEVFGLTA